MILVLPVTTGAQRAPVSLRMGSAGSHMQRIFVMVAGAALVAAIPLLAREHVSPAVQPSAELGRKLFTEKCGSCHDGDAAKRLPDGTTLVDRLAARPDVRTAAASRLRKFTAPQQDALVAYLTHLEERRKAEAH
jgi:mono/diheme cytochrome c family protein